MESLVASESDLARALGRLETRTPYAEAMAQRSGGQRLRLDKQAVTVAPAPHLEGAAFRAWTGTHWVETAVSGLTASALGTAAEELAARLPASAANRGPPGESATSTGERRTVERRPTVDLSVEERIAWARQRLDWATAVPGVSNAFVQLQTSVDERLFLSTAGARCHQTLAHTLGTVAAVAIENGNVQLDFIQRGATGGAEILDEVGETEVTHIAKEAKALLTAPPVPTGEMDVILDPTVTGTFAHESFGHGTEADQMVRGRSYLKPLLGKEVGPESLTLVDDGSLEGGWGTIYWDDEGWPARRTVLIDHGRFVEALHDRESAALLGRHPTGNTRRADFLSRPYVRMTNTFVEPGSTPVEELIRETRDGILMQTFTSGIEDPLGGQMQLKSAKGRRIRNGELAELLPSMALSGKVLEFLRSIRGVSKKEDFGLSAGFCGKGHTDLLLTATGGPYLASRAVVGPA